MTRNTPAVESRADSVGEKVLPGANECMARIRMRKTSLPNTAPDTSPSRSPPPERIRFSQKIMRPTWRFSRPSTPYRPNSVLRRDMRKLLMYSM